MVGAQRNRHNCRSKERVVEGAWGGQGVRQSASLPLRCFLIDLWRESMSLLVTGSIGIDTVETPFGKRGEVIGGSAIYFAYAASFFTPVRLVGVVGEDCPDCFGSIFQNRDVDT